MKKNKQYLILIFLLLIAGPDFAFNIQILQEKAKEKVALITDRSLYITGEKMQFFATLLNPAITNGAGQSQILYCELIAPDGNKLSGNKYLIDQSVAAGCLVIPEDVITGTYYLRAYTKQMRNYGPESYAYRQIRIVNPGRNEVIATDKKGTMGGEQIIRASKNPLVDFLSVSVEKAVYTYTDSIKLTILATNESLHKIMSLTLSVAPENTVSSSMFVPVTIVQNADKTDYYAETPGLSLTGKITEGTSRYPVKGIRINLSIIGEGRDFMSVRTDSIGRFYFALPDYTGYRDLFLGAEKTPNADLKIWVDNDFCTLPVYLQSPVFTLTEAERKAALYMAENVQVNTHFHSDSIPESNDDKKEELAFYGQPTDILYLDQFVQLPNLEEYFNELPGLVKVRKRSGEKYFKVMGSEDLVFYDPLVMVDWVAVDETEKILAISPQNISHIEIVNKVYVKGEQTYGGIISIISKKGDFAGIDLPSAGLFINYQFLPENKCQENSANFTANNPDVRNTVLWKPTLKLPTSKPEILIFQAPDTPGKYSVVLEGITTDGEIFSVTSGFEITN